MVKKTEREKALKFSKLHGTGNDFILTDGAEVEKTGMEPGELAKRVCDRRFGVGADGFMFHAPTGKARIRMLYFNSDGSRAEMCGNGLRCFARYVHEAADVSEEAFLVETDAGLYPVRIGADREVEIAMGLPLTRAEAVPALGAATDRFMRERLETPQGIFTVSALRLGVPHAVVFKNENPEWGVSTTGPLIEGMRNRFPEGINVNFVTVVSRGALKVETWERGAGRTLSCGTGACASAYAARLFGYVEPAVEVLVPGGALRVRIERESLYLKGPAHWICDGIYRVESPHL